MAHAIFISYRREDSGWSTQALYTALSGHFAEERVFMDLDDIHGGDDFAEVIRSALSQCEVLIAVIGPQWLTASKDGVRRLDDPKDYVASEIGTALERGIRVIPVLIDETSFPQADDLPEKLKSLRRRNALSIERESFTEDVAKLVNILERQVGLERVSSPSSKQESKSQVKVAWIGAVGAVVAAIIGGLFMLFSGSGSEIHINEVQTHDGGITTIGGEVTIYQSDPEVRKALDGLLGEVAKLQLDLQQKEAQIDELNKAVVSMAELRTNPDVRPEIDAALAELAEGKTEAAEAIFQQVAASHLAAGAEANAKAAAAFRHIGALAFLHDTDKALSAYRRATELDPSNPEGWNQLGLLEMRVGNLQAADEAYQAVMRLGEAENDKGLIAIAYGNLGILYEIRGDLEQSEAMHRLSLATNQELGRKRGMALDYGNLGNVFRISGDLEQAEAMYSKALAFGKELGSKEIMAAAYGNFGIVYSHQGDLELAMVMLSKALALGIELGSKDFMAASYGNLGNVHRIKGNLEQAETMFGKALALDEELGNKEGMAANYGNLGLLYHTRGDLEQAEAAWNKSLELFQEVGATPQAKRAQALLDSLREE